MKRWFLAGIAACSILVGGTVWVWQSLNRQPMLTETVLAMRDHVSLLAAINDMCVVDKPAVANPDNSLMVLASVRAPLYPEKGIADIPKFVSKPTTFQMAAVNYSAELRDQRVKLDQEITGEESVSRWFKVAIVLCGGFAAIAVGLKPLIEKINNIKLDTSIAAAAIILTGTVGTLSSLSAFAETQASLLQHQRTLAQLQQLHWRVGNDVFAATDLCKNDQDLGKVGAWKYRFEEITNEAMPSISKPGDIAAVNPSARLPPS
jgi:fluoride ion exporter CrcB/FEX